jgi:Zn finger protein HypA/HybF involved in hydrogenase expression
MADISAIGAALGALKAAKDIAESMVGLRDASAFQGKMLEFQSKIIDANNAAFAAQDERAALMEKIGELKKRVAEFEAWEAEEQRYHLSECSPGTFAYILKKSMANREPGHALCAACFQKKKKSILQDNGKSMIKDHAFTCPECKAEVKTQGQPLPTFASEDV